MQSRISTGNQIVRNGLVLWLDASNYPGSGTTWTDISGRNNNGTLTNGPTYSSNNSGTFIFDGVNDIVFAPNNFFSYPSLQTFTVSLWFKSSQTTGGTLFGQQNTNDPGSPGGWVPVVYLQSNGLIRAEPFWTNGTSNAITNSAALNDNMWHNITTTFNSGTHNLYVDGYYITQRTGLSLNAYTGTYYYMIGAGAAGSRGLGTNYFSGSISNFNFYNRALSASEISQNFNALRGRYGI